MKSKGISPLIAAVLLIAFTMAVASLFAQWAPQLFESAQGDTINRSSTIQSCSRFNIQVESANETHATVSQVAGDEALGNVSVTWYYDGEAPTQEFTDIETVQGFGRTVNDVGGSYTLNRVEAQSLECDTVTASFPPSEQ